MTSGRNGANFKIFSQELKGRSQIQCNSLFSFNDNFKLSKLGRESVIDGSIRSYSRSPQLLNNQYMSASCSFRKQILEKKDFFVPYRVTDCTQKKIAKYAKEFNYKQSEVKSIMCNHNIDYIKSNKNISKRFKEYSLEQNSFLHNSLLNRSSRQNLEFIRQCQKDNEERQTD